MVALSPSGEEAILTTVITALKNADDLSACGCKHEVSGNECPLATQNKRLGCAHPGVRVLLNAMSALRRLEVIKSPRFEKRQQTIMSLNEEMEDYDNAVSAWMDPTTPEDIRPEQERIIRHKNRFRLALIRMAQKRLNELNLAA